MISKQTIREAALRQSAVDCSCAPEDFLKNENVVTESKAAEGTSRYLAVPHACALFSYGNNVVASCRRDLMPEVKRFIDGAETIYRCFDVPALYELNGILEKAGARIEWIHLCFLPDPERVFGAEIPCPYEMREMGPEDFRGLYTPEWRNALSKDRKELDRLAIGAFDGERLIGMAGCSADCPEMWQIGIDVRPEYRRQGIAAALTNRLARAVFERGMIPFYEAAWGNIRSIRNGLRSGFIPAWAVATSKQGC